MQATEIRRVILVVLDGLRPDAIERFDLANIRRVARAGASTSHGKTVSPSLTWPAITSMMSGVPPQIHGILADSVHLPKPQARLTPLPELLARSGFPSNAFIGEIPVLYKGIAGRIAKGLGFAEARFAGRNAIEVTRVARTTLRTQRRGLIFIHLVDADRAGHEHGWMSELYGEAARDMDYAFDWLVRETKLERDPHTLLVALADHGGGGLVHNDHDGDHPLNETIPMLLAGGAVANAELQDAHLLDVPSTIAWALGIGTPSYRGRVLLEAFGGAAGDGVRPQSAVA